MTVIISACAGEKETFNDTPTLKETGSPLSTQATEESATPTPAQVGTVETQTPLTVSPVPATPTPLSDGTYVWKWGAWRDPATDAAYVAPTPIPTAPPYQAPAPVATSSGASSYSDCFSHPDRFNWLKYASAYPWPLDELATVIQRESGGDLCAVNSSSGATCWIQQHPGGPSFLDPAVCMAQGYAKWVDGGGSFAKHWYRFW